MDQRADSSPLQVLAQLIPRRVVDWLAAYGAIDYQRGSELYYFNRRSRPALERDVGRRQVLQFA